MQKNIIVYPILASSLAIVGLPLYIYLPTFYASNLGLGFTAVGIILFLARVADVIADPYIGYLSDKSLKKFKSRKPLIIFGSILLLISFYFLVNPNKEFTSLWLLIFSILIYIGWSFVNIPYLTYSSEISLDYHLKNRLNASREFFTIIGVLLALVIPVFLAQDLLEEKLVSLFLLFAVIFIPSVISILFYFKPKVLQESSDFKFKDIKTIYKKANKLKSLQLGFLFNNLANAVPATLFLLFIEVIIQKKEYSEEILALYFLSGIVFLPFWLMLSKKVSKKSIWILSILIASFSFIFVLFLNEGDYVAFAIISIISGSSLGADIAFPTSIHSDVAQEEKVKDMSGFLFGIWAMITKLALALGVVITFGILGLFSFDKTALTPISIMALHLSYGLLPVVLKVTALIFILRFKEKI